MADTRVTFLGTGDAYCAGGRHQAGYLVQAKETCFLLDCGTTTLAALKRSGVAIDSIETILISHLHGDHFAGLPFLFLEYVYVEPRRRPLQIAGPPGMAERVGALFRTMYREAGAQALPFPVRFVEMLPERRLQIGPLTVHPFRVPHQEQEISLGVSVFAGDRKIVYSGDTGWTEKLVEQSEAADLLICECSFFETRLSSHLDYPRIEENRRRLSAKRTILTHLGHEVLARRTEIEMELASDGLVVDLS